MTSGTYDIDGKCSVCHTEHPCNCEVEDMTYPKDIHGLYETNEESDADRMRTAELDAQEQDNGM